MIVLFKNKKNKRTLLCVCCVLLVEFTTILMDHKKRHNLNIILREKMSQFKAIVTLKSVTKVYLGLIKASQCKILGQHKASQ